MKKEKNLRNKRILAIGGIIIALLLVLTGCAGKNNNPNTPENKIENQAQSTETQSDNTVTKQDTNSTKNQTSNTNAQLNNQVSNSTNNEKSNNASTNTKSTTSNELVVNREGMSETVSSKEYASTLGYTMRYATEYFSVSYHDDGDWYECSQGTDCVLVEKENISYSKKIATLSNTSKTNVNGYEAVYTTRRAEGQFETTYYINSGKDSTYEITTSCQDTTEYREGLGKIMDAMVQTFSVK